MAEGLALPSSCTGDTAHVRDESAEGSSESRTPHRSDSDGSNSDWEDYDYFSTVLETRDTDVFSTPSKVTDVHCIRISTCEDHDHHTIVGKWMVFRHFDELDRYWDMIRTAIFNYDMEGCTHAFCSTMRYNPTACGPGPDKSGVICVYTTKYDIDAIGFKLIEIAQQDIKYKLDDDSRDFRYVHVGSGKVSIKTIHWNDGNPSFDCVGRLCPGTSYDKQDLWHLNVVDAPEPFATRSIYGRWVLPLEYEEMTGLWHYLKKLIESEEDNFGVIKMVCPPKRNYQSATEVPVIHVYTSDADREMVGTKLINLIKRDIHFEKISIYRSILRNEGTYTLNWNDGEPEVTNNGQCEIFIAKPSQVHHTHWVHMPSVRENESSEVVGNWMVFKHFDEVDLTWEQICRAMARGELQYCPKAKCSTIRYDPTVQGPGPVTTAAIFVYASEEQDINTIGFELIEMAKQDIKYKSFDESSGSRRSPMKTLFWNNGKPSFSCEDMPCHGTSNNKEDIWQLNVVTAPEPLGSLYDDGRWVLSLEKTELTRLWHSLKKKISGTESYGVIKMVCPPRQGRSASFFHVYTSEQHKESVGIKLINLVKKDICYEHRHSHTGHKEILFWNDGEPGYERIRRMGVTKNRRT